MFLRKADEYQYIFAGTCSCLGILRNFAQVLTQLTTFEYFVWIFPASQNRVHENRVEYGLLWYSKIVYRLKNKKRSTFC